MSTENQIQERQPVVVDSGEFAGLMDTARFNQGWRIARMFSETQLVPKHFQGKPADCFVGMQMAFRLGVDPLMMLQNTYIVHGRPGIEAKLAIALINTSGMFADPLDYEVEGDDPHKDGYRVRAVAVRKSTGKEIKGPWIDWKMVRAEGWDKKDGSKWKTMPAQMFLYRAATFFGRLYCPERLMGMQTADELQDVEPIDVTPPTPRLSLADQVQAKVEPDAPAVVKESLTVPDEQLPFVVSPQDHLTNILGGYCGGDETAMNTILRDITGNKDVSICDIPRFTDKATEVLIKSLEEQIEADAEFRGEK